MEENSDSERNENGDEDFGKFDWDNFRESRYTYVFNYLDEKTNYYYPYFELFSKSKERILKAKQDPQYFELRLYKSPDTPPYDFYIHYNNSLLRMLIKYFKEVFQEQSFKNGYQPQHKYYKLILPKSKYLEIIEFINNYELLPIRDLLFEVIAIGQNFYVKEIAFWEKSEMQKIIKTAETESRKAFEVVEKVFSSEWNQLDTIVKSSELQRINFVFDDETVKLEHSWLAKEFVEHFKNYYDNRLFKDWRKELEHYHLRFTDEKENQKFKYKLAISLYNLLTETGLFQISKTEPTPNRLMLCIAEILEFCLVKVAEPDELSTIKAKNIRNWIKRNEIKPSTTHAKFPYNRERLLMYFESDFINLGEEVKRVDALNIGLFVAKRFDLDNLIGDFSHITQCLQQVTFFIGHQTSSEGRITQNTIPEFENFKYLLNNLKDKRKIVSFKYKFEGDEVENELTQRLPIYQIEEALKYYVQDQRVEVDTDLILTSVVKSDENTFSIKQQESFALPEERFMVRFVKSFYNYLHVVSPPKKFESLPSNRYYEIIGVILLESGFFYQKNLDEEYVKEKIRQWHEL